MNPKELFQQKRSIKSMKFKELNQFIFKEKQEEINFSLFTKLNNMKDFLIHSLFLSSPY